MSFEDAEAAAEEIAMGIGFWERWFGIWGGGSLRKEVEESGEGSGETVIYWDSEGKRGPHIRGRGLSTSGSHFRRDMDFPCTILDDATCISYFLFLSLWL